MLQKICQYSSVKDYKYPILFKFVLNPSLNTFVVSILRHWDMTASKANTVCFYSQQPHTFL